jgi:hypothetical protein
VLARIVTAVIAGAAIAWGSVTIPIFSRQATIENIAHRIIRGEPYKIDVLTRQMPVVEAVESSTDCRPIALWSAAIIRLRLVERARREATGKSVDTQEMKMLDSSLRRSLSCSPAEPFLWLVLYWVESDQNGFKPEYLNYLKMSYDLGPNEGWIAIKRNPVTFAEYKRLPRELAADAVNEFVALVNSEFYEQAVEVFSGLDGPVREAILPHLKTLPLRIRKAFVRAAYDRGIDVKLPGVEWPEGKPRWR